MLDLLFFFFFMVRMNLFIFFSFTVKIVCGEREKKERNRVFLIGKSNKAKSTQIRNLRQDSLMNFLYLGIRRSFLDWIDLNWSMMAFSLENTNT